MFDVRILAHGKISDVTDGFHLPDHMPFSVYMRPVSSDADDTLCVCRCQNDTELSELPVPVGDWTPAKIVAIAPDGIDTENFDVYWATT